ncbi:MAG: hypothetical protein E7328_06110 [Clostridiales bacterium]|nr:hypothetical protein [Clostridiales bacterium]
MKRHSSFIRSFVFLLCFGIVLCLLPSPALAAYPGADGLGVLTENDPKSQTLTDGKAHLYVTPGGGWIEIRDVGYDIHEASANPNYGWEFVRWGTYYESNGLIKNGTNPKQKLMLGFLDDFVDSYIFVSPDSFEAYDPERLWLEIIDLDDDMTLKEDFYLYAVFAPKVKLLSDSNDEVGVVAMGQEFGEKVKMEFTATYGYYLQPYFKLGGRDFVGITINDAPVDPARCTIKDDKVYLDGVNITEPSTIRLQTRGWPFTVAFDGNGGTGSMESQTFYTEDACRLNPNTFTREGYAFAGWNTRRDGKGTTYDDGDRVIIWDAEQGDTVTLYAQWEHTAHEGGTATCKEGAVCSVCKKVYTGKDPNNHVGQPGWVQTETQHERKYSCCGKITVGLSDHEWEDGICSICRYIDENGTGGGGAIIGGGTGGSSGDGTGEDGGTPGDDTGSGTDPEVPKTGDGRLALPLTLMALALAAMVMILYKKHHA